MNSMNSRSLPRLELGTVFNNVSLTLGRQLVGMGFQLAFIILIARKLGPQGNGNYSIALLLPVFLTMVCTLGVPAANVYYLGRKDISLKNALQFNYGFWLIGSAVGLLIGCGVVACFAETLIPGAPTALLWTAVSLTPLSLLRSLLESILQGIQDFKGFNAGILAPLVITLFAACLLVWGLELGSYGAVCSWGIGQLTGVVTCFWVLRRSASPTDTSVSSKAYIGLCLRYGTKAYIGNLLGIANYRANFYMVNLLLNPAATGIFAVAVQIMERFWMLAQAVSTVLLPRLAELDSHDDARREITPLAARWVTYLGLLAVIFIILVVKPMVLWIFGASYIETAEVLIWLLPGAAAMNCVKILANDIAARGRPDLNIWIVGVTLSFNIIGNLYFIPAMGIIGAATATSLAYFVTAVITLAIYAKLSKNVFWRPLIFERNDLRYLGRVLSKILLSKRTL